MSLQTRYRPTPFHAGPSDHRAPVHRRLSGVLPCRSRSKAGSMVMTSGSTYVTGGAFGPKSRGGLVTVLGGVAGPEGGGVCAMARREPSAAAPATAPMVVKSMRRERGSSAIAEPPLGNDRGTRIVSARGATVAEGCQHRQSGAGESVLIGKSPSPLCLRAELSLAT